MSIIHVNQIKNQVTKLFADAIDLSDCTNHPPEMREAFFLTRGLAAYAVHYMSGADVKNSAGAVTDDTGDNGIDAIHYDEANKRLYLIQSKWIKDGSGEPDNGDVKKFVSGVRDIFNQDFDRFNAKIHARKASVNVALNDPATRYDVVIVYTGSNRLALPSQRDFDDLAAEMNDVSEVLTVTTLNQGELHKSLTAGISGEPINLQVVLRAWGRKEEPHEALYGQLTAEQIVDWWTKYRSRLFARNLRSVLGETDVNAEMRQTLEKRPAEFWYFNNGITIVTKKTTKAMAGGASTDFGTFHCEDVSVVNGAQTVGTIGKFGENNLAGVQNVVIPLRIIVRGDNLEFGEEVTRTNNRQNRIENRDFVALDPEQGRIRTELAIDEIDYQLIRSESVVRNDRTFDLVEATTALACASGTIRLPVQLKREISKLWDDISKAPYKELFNASIPGLYVWRCVQIQRRIDRALETFVSQNAKMSYWSVRTHGNRLLAAIIFQALPVKSLKDPNAVLDQIASEETINAAVNLYVPITSNVLLKYYPGSIIPTLFKNLKKCEHLAREAKALAVVHGAAQAPPLGGSAFQTNIPA